MDESSLQYAGWRVALAAATGVLFASFFFMSFGVFVKPLANEFGGSRQAVSGAYGVMTLGAALAAPFVGPVVYTRIVSTWFDRKRGMALAVVVSGAAIGGIVRPSLSQALVDLLGWRTAALVLGAAMVLIGVPVAMLFVGQRADGSIAGPADPPRFHVKRALRSRIFWTITVVVFGSTIAMNGPLVHMQALLTDRGVTPATAAALGSVAGVAGLAGRLVTGWLVDRFNAARIAFALLCLVASGAYFLTSDRPVAVNIAGGFVMAFGAGGELDAIPYLLSRHFGVRSMAALYGLVWSAWGIAGAIGSVLMGRIFDMTGSYDAALVGFALGTGAVATLMLTLPAYANSPQGHATV